MTTFRKHVFPKFDKPIVVDSSDIAWFLLIMFSNYFRLFKFFISLKKKTEIDLNPLR